MSASPESSGFASPFETAVKEYETQAGIKLVEHPLAKKLEKCDSVLSVTRVLEDHLQAFRRSNGKMINSLKRIVHILRALSTCVFLNESIGLAVRGNALMASFILVPDVCFLAILICEHSFRWRLYLPHSTSLPRFLLASLRSLLGD
jgi:hypothetical protein